MISGDPGKQQESVPVRTLHLVSQVACDRGIKAVGAVLIPGDVKPRYIEGLNLPVTKTVKKTVKGLQRLLNERGAFALLKVRANWTVLVLKLGNEHIIAIIVKGENAYPQADGLRIAAKHYSLRLAASTSSATRKITPN